MADLSRVPKPLLAFWGTIQAGVYQKATTGQLYSALRGAMADAGISAIPGMFQGVTILRSIAARQRRASEAFMKAAPGAAADAAWFADSINSRPQQAQDAYGRWQFRWQHNYVDNGVAGSSWRVVSFEGTLPPTKEEIVSEIMATAEYLSRKYQVQNAGIGMVVPLRV